MLRFLVAIALLLAEGGPALAAAGALSDCSGTVGTNSAAITFPKSGATGPNFPQAYLEIANPSASATLWVNATGGTAAANAAGSAAIAPSGYLWFDGEVQPGRVSIIASAGATPFTCWYK